MDVISDGVDEAYLQDLIVHPDHQHQGIGSALLSIVKERIKQNGIKMATLVFEPGLIEFYRKAGFQIIVGGLIDFEKPSD